LDSHQWPELVTNICQMTLHFLRQDFLSCS
jgi:hypothetical protein